MFSYGALLFNLAKAEFSAIFHVDCIEKIGYRQDRAIEQPFAAGRAGSQKKSLPIDGGCRRWPFGFSFVLSHV